MSVSRAIVLPSNTKGFIIKLNSTQLWSRTLPSGYVCGNGRHYVFTTSADYQTAINSDPLGTFIVLIIGIFITAVVIAMVPLLIALSKQMFGAENNIINYIRNNVVERMVDQNDADASDIDDADDDDDEHIAKKKRKRGLSVFATVWICIATVIILFVSVFISQLLCYNMRWRNIYKKEVVNDCYELELGDKKSVSDNEILNNGVDLVYYSDSNTAVFTLDAYSGTYHSNNNSLAYDFDLSPNKFTCKYVPVVYIGDVRVGNKKTKNSCHANELSSYVQKCSGSYFEEEDHDWESVNSDNRVVSNNMVTITAYDSKYHDRYKKIYEDYDAPSAHDVLHNDFRRCFMNASGSSFSANGAWCAANGCTRSRARVTYHVSYWPLCVSTNTAVAAIARRTVDGKSEVLDTNGFSRLDSEEYPFGYYDLCATGTGIITRNAISTPCRLKRSSDKKVEIINGYYVFNDGEVNENYIVSHVLANDIEYKYGVLSARISSNDNNYASNSLVISDSATKITYTLKNANKYSEFRRPCVRVQTYDKVINNITHAYVQSDDTEMCYITVSWFGNDMQLIALSPGSVQEITGADMWSCETSEDYSALGTSCGSEIMSYFATPQHNSTMPLSPIVYDGHGAPETALDSNDSGIINGNITMKKITAYVSIVVCCLLVAFVVVIVIIKVTGNNKGKR